MWLQDLGDGKEMFTVYIEEISCHSPERKRELGNSLFLFRFELVLKTSQFLYEPF
jgi:hypothetical protein